MSPQKCTGFSEQISRSTGISDCKVQHKRGLCQRDIKKKNPENTILKIFFYQNLLKSVYSKSAHFPIKLTKFSNSGRFNNALIINNSWRTGKNLVKTFSVSPLLSWPSQINLQNMSAMTVCSKVLNVSENTLFSTSNLTKKRNKNKTPTICSLVSVESNTSNGENSCSTLLKKEMLNFKIKKIFQDHFNVLNSREICCTLHQHTHYSFSVSRNVSC